MCERERVCERVCVCVSEVVVAGVATDSVALVLPVRLHDGPRGETLNSKPYALAFPHRLALCVSVSMSPSLSRCLSLSLSLSLCVSLYA